MILNFKRQLYYQTEFYTNPRRRDCHKGLINNKQLHQISESKPNNEEYNVPNNNDFISFHSKLIIRWADERRGWTFRALLQIYAVRHQSQVIRVKTFRFELGYYSSKPCKSQVHHFVDHWLADVRNRVRGLRDRLSPYIAAH